MLKKQIFQIAIPSVFANIAVVLPGIADAVVLGHLPSEIYLAGAALAGVVFSYLIWGMGFLRMSTLGLTAQANGAGNENESKAWFFRSIIVGLIAGVLLLTLSQSIKEVAWFFISSQKAVFEQADIYFNVRAYSLPAVFMNMCINGWLLGKQNAKASMVLIVSENVLNIILNIFFVYQLHLDTYGVALATVISAWTAVFLGFFIIQKKYFLFTRLLVFIRPAIRNAPWASFFKLNVNIFIRTLCLIIVFSWFTTASAVKDSQTLALNSLMMQFFTFFSFFMDGLAAAAESLCGKLIGARKFLTLKVLLKLIFRYGFTISVFISLLYWVFNKSIFSLLTQNNDLILLSEKYLFIVILIPPVSFAAFLWDGIFVGATLGNGMRNVMIIVVCFFFPVYFLLKNTIPDFALWISFLFFLTGRSVLMWMYWKTKRAPKSSFYKKYLSWI